MRCRHFSHVLNIFVLSLGPPEAGEADPDPTAEDHAAGAVHVPTAKAQEDGLGLPPRIRPIQDLQASLDLDQGLR